MSKKISKKLKKAFTLVELVIVIAIIAILTSVSVVTYFGVTNSARKSVLTEEATSLKKELQAVSARQEPVIMKNYPGVKLMDLPSPLLLKQKMSID